MPVVLLAIILYPLPFLPHVFACAAEIPLRLGLLFVENAPETTWSMAEGGIIPHAIGRIIIFSVFLAGMSLQGHENTECADAWKACL
jgi:hypothetical protein